MRIYEFEASICHTLFQFRYGKTPDMGNSDHFTHDNGKNGPESTFLSYTMRF